MGIRTNNNDLIQIDAVFIRESAKGILLDCEGDHEWFAKSQVNFNKETEKLICPRWILNEKFPGEQYDAFEG